MKVTVADVMREVNSVFPHADMSGTWRIENGALIPGDLLLEGDWIALEGSRHNDGVYCVGEGGRLDGARDETWEGAVWLLKPPPAFLGLCEEIAAWAEKHPEDGVKREAFGAYSVEHAVGADGLPMDWRHVFAASLLPWRRMFREVPLTC